MLDAFKVTEANWRDATKFQPHFAISETPAFVGRAVAALAQDPQVARWNGNSLSSGQLAKVTDAAYNVAWSFIARQIRAGAAVTEIDVQSRIVEFFEERGSYADHPPIVGVGPHSGDPHYSPSADSNSPVREGDFVLIDLWAKLKKPRSIYSDLTRVGFVGSAVPEQYERIFQIVAAARDAGIRIVREAFAAKRPLRGYEVGRQARERGAWVVYGGIHATLFPDEPREHGAAHAVVKGDGDIVWAEVVRDCMAGRPAGIYDAGRVTGSNFVSARWDLLPEGAYMWASVQTVRGCPQPVSQIFVFSSVFPMFTPKPISTAVSAASLPALAPVPAVPLVPALPP